MINLSEFRKTEKTDTVDQVVGGEAEAVTGLDQNQDLALPRLDINPDAVPKMDLDFSISFEPDDLDLSYVNNNIVEMSRSAEANAEVSKLSSKITGADEKQVQNTLMSGDDDPVKELVNYVQEELDKAVFLRGQEDLNAAETPEEVVTVLERVREEKRPVTLDVIRSYAIGNVEGVVPERMGHITRHALKRMALAQEISKAENELINAQGFFQVVGDFLEYIPPVLGTSSEELMKYKLGLDEVLNKLDKADSSTKMAVLQEALDAWENQESLLFKNNNSLMTSAQFASLRSAILQGGMEFAEQGEWTQAQRNQLVETLANVGFEIPVLGGISDLVKFISRRFLSGGNADINYELSPQMLSRLFDPNRPSEKNITYQTLEEVSEYVSRRDVLAEEAKKKNTRKFRMELEKEKKNLGALKSKTLNQSDVNKEARALANEKKIKFKDAKKEVKEQKNALIMQIETRLKAVQEHIDTFEEAARAEAEVSRIDQFLRDGRMKPEDLLVPTGRTVYQPTTRRNSNVVDTEYIEVPLNKLKLEQQGGLRAVKEASGMSTEDIATRQAPTPTSDNDIGFFNPLEDNSTMNDLILIDKDVTSIGMQMARDLEKRAGTSLKPVHSGMGFDGYKDDNSLGMFSLLFGDGDKGGFENATDAFEAARKGLAGYNYEIVEQEGRFFARVEVEHSFNPNKDVKNLYVDPTQEITEVEVKTLNFLRTLGSDVLKDVFALKGVNRSAVQKLERQFKEATDGLKLSQRKDLEKSLLKGDAEAEEWFRIEDFKAATGVEDKNVFDAYRQIRKIYDDIWEIRNRLYYQKLNAKGQKFVDDGGEGNLGKVLNPNSKDEISTADGLVLDIETRKLVEPNPKDSAIYVKLTNAIEDSEGGLRTVVRINPDRVKPLPKSLLTKRTGHIDRFYRETGWIVRKEFEEVIDGEVVVRQKTTHIVKSREEAKEIAEETGGKESRARENEELDDIFSRTDEVQFSYGSSHTKKRNEQLKGADGGEAPIFNAFESLGRSIAGMQKTLDYNMMQSLKSRFYNEFEDLLEEGKVTRFSHDLGRMTNAKANKEESRNRLTQMQRWHQYIRMLDSYEKGGEMKRTTKLLESTIGRMFNFSPDAAVATQNLLKRVADLVVVWNPLYQIPQNLMPTFYLAVTNGASGFKAALGIAPIIRAYNKGDYKGLGKWLGVDESVAKEFLSELNTNGLIDAVGRSNDFLDLARGDVESAAATTGKYVGKKLKKYAGGGLYEASRRGQEGSIALMNILSYTTEFHKAMKAGKKFNAKTKADISFKAQKNLQTQNSMDLLWYQDPSSFWRVPFQFYQHMHKMFLDVVAEPQYRVITAAVETILKRKFSEGKYFGKEAGAYADSFSKALVTTMVTYGVFGVTGGMGENIGTMVEDLIRRKSPDAADTMAGNVLLNGGLSESFNAALKYFGGEGAVNIATTFGPAGFLDMFNDFFVENAPNFNPLGVSGLVLGGIGESLFSVAAITTADEIDTFDKSVAIARELAEPFQGLKNIEKAVLAYAFEQMPYASSLSGTMKVEAVEAMMLAANIQPDLMTDFYNKADFRSTPTKITDIFTGDFWASKITETMMQAMAQDMLMLKGQKNLFEGDDVDFMDFDKIRRKWVGAAKSLTPKSMHSKVEKIFVDRSLKAGTPVYEEYVKPYLQKNYKGNLADYLRVLEQKAQSEEARKVFRIAREEAEKSDEIYKILEGEE